MSIASSAAWERSRDVHEASAVSSLSIRAILFRWSMTWILRAAASADPQTASMNSSRCRSRPRLASGHSMFFSIVRLSPAPLTPQALFRGQKRKRPPTEAALRFRRFRRRLLLSLYRELFPLARAFDPKCLTLWLLKHTGQSPARFRFQT